MRSRSQKIAFAIILALLLGGMLAAPAIGAADPYELDNTWATATAIATDGAPQAHRIDPGSDVDWVKFDVEAGYFYRVQTAANGSDTVDTYLELYAANGTTLLASDDDNGDGTYSMILYQPSGAGTLYAKVRSYNAADMGDYLLAVVDLRDEYEPDDSPLAATAISPGDNPQERVLSPGDEDWVYFDAEGLTAYRAEIVPAGTSVDAQGKIEIYDSDGVTLLASGLSQADGFTEQGRRLYVRVSGRTEGDCGRYLLKVQRTPEAVLWVSHSSVSMDETPFGSTARESVRVVNAGGSDLELTTLGLTGSSSFSLEGAPTLPMTLAPRTVIAFDVCFTPANEPPPSAPTFTKTYNGSTLLAVYTQYSVTVYPPYDWHNYGGTGDAPISWSAGSYSSQSTRSVYAGASYGVRWYAPTTNNYLFHLSTQFALSLPGASWSSSVNAEATSAGGVSLIRLPDAELALETSVGAKTVPVFGSAAPPAAPDTTPPVTTEDYDGLWHNDAVTVTFSATDNEGGSGMGGGDAKTEYSHDGGTTWHEGTEVTYRTWKRGGGSGVHTLLYRSTDAAGNLEEACSCEVLMDARPPRTTDDAPLTPQTSAVTVHLTAVDSLFGVTACSGVATTWYSPDGGGWTQGTEVPVSGAGLHWIAYYSVDNAGNREYVKWCSVTLAAP